MNVKELKEIISKYNDDDRVIRLNYGCGEIDCDTEDDYHTVVDSLPEEGFLRFV